MLPALVVPTKRKQETQGKILTNVRSDRHGREKPNAAIASASEVSREGINMSATTIWRTLRQSGLKKDEPEEEA